MKKILSIFITLSSFLFLYGGIAIVYYALSIIFPSEQNHFLDIVRVVMFLFTFLFIFSIIISGRFYNSFTRVVYLLSSVWMGFFFYLFIAVSVYSIIRFLGSLVYPDFTFYYGGIGLVCGAICVTLYGLFHAEDIKTTRIQISLPRLHDAWKSRVAVFVSDIHIGQIHSTPFTERIRDEIRKHTPDIVFLGGDVYDGTATSIHEPLTPLVEINPPLGIHFVTGNHEQFTSDTKFEDAIRNAGINVLNNTYIEIDNLQILGVDYRTSVLRENFKQILDGMNIDASKPSILIKHVPTHVDVTAQADISFQISGHTHRAQVWPLSHIPKIVFKGFDSGLRKLNNTHVFTSSGVGTWGPPLRVGTHAEIVVITFEERDET